MVRLSPRLSRQPPNLRWCSMINLANTGVESPNAAESRGQCDLIHLQIRFIDQLLREVQTASLSHRYRSRAKMFQKQAPQVPRSDSQTFRENFYSSVLKPTLSDQAQRP